MRSLLTGRHALATCLSALLLALVPAPVRAQTNTKLGTNAGFSITTGVDNTAIGNLALRLDTTGSSNTAVGSLALSNNVVGANNTALGFGALQFNTASFNTAVGRVALFSNTTGTNNVAFGNATMYATTTGSLNTGFGTQALRLNTTGASNVALGYQSLFSNVTGSFNVAVGDGSLYNSKGTGNIGLGDDAGFNLTTGSNNIYIGNPGGVPGGGTATESGTIRIGYTKNGATGYHTDTYLAGVVHGDGTALTNVPTTALNGAITSAQIATGAVTLGKIGDGAISVSNLLTSVAPTAGQVLSYNGTTLSWTIPGGAWSTNGTNAFYNVGNVGIGTSTPGDALHLQSGGGGIRFNPSVEQIGSSGNGFELSLVGGVPASTLRGAQLRLGGGSRGDLDVNAAIFLQNGVERMRINNSGKVGIGTSTPAGQLEIYGAQDALRITGFGPVLTFRDTGNSSARSAIQAVAGDTNIFAESYLSGANVSAFLKLSNAGNVGIGSSQPVGKLEVVAQDALRLIGYQPFLTLYDSNSGYSRGRIQSLAGFMNFFTEAYLNGSNTNAYAQLSDVGVFSVKALTIRGGADLAEPFQMKEDELDKGSVVVIDAEHPGRLKRSHGAYDRRVAGIVSGANGVNPGIALHQEGVLEGGQNVALSGRVYVQADASGGAIAPGDLLTTSDTPGHAMKVTDYPRAQGAVIGKAMSALKEGTGMVLVLVTLQ